MGAAVLGADAAPQRLVTGVTTPRKHQVGSGVVEFLVALLVLATYLVVLSRGQIFNGHLL